MDIHEAIKVRHAVRSYLDQSISENIIRELQKEIDLCNHEGNLHIQLVVNEPKAFNGFMAHYGKFSGVSNYVALVGEKGLNIEEKLGYYGERIALKAQMLGLNTCWVALTFSKGAVKTSSRINRDENLFCVLALGYGAVQGVPHQSKKMSDLCRVEGDMPDWFKSGMEAVLLAPTAMNQQKFLFTLNGKRVKAESLGGFYSKIDLGIVKYHFEIGAGKDNFIWD